MVNLKSYSVLLGRILLALIFVMSGFNKIMGWEQTAGYMASKGMPMVPLFLSLALIIELLGGISVMLGIKAKIGALLLIVFLIPTTIIFHNFWALEGMEMQMNMIAFMKNLSIMGGLLILAHFGAGPLSIDNRQKS